MGYDDRPTAGSPAGEIQAVTERSGGINGQKRLLEMGRLPTRIGDEERVAEGCTTIA
ncbi:MAG TPA: hypothetical protein VFZ21_06590 [Gemmatimonadaceae bacterium]|nr:hypothetical protein [Gemmatimonadaceae bacterium]